MVLKSYHGFCLVGHKYNLPQAARLALPLKEAQDVTLPHGPLHVTDDGAAGIIDELDADLGHVSGVAGAAEDAVDFSELHGLVHLSLFWGGEGGVEGGTEWEASEGE